MTSKGGGGGRGNRCYKWQPQKALAQPASPPTPRPASSQQLVREFTAMRTNGTGLPECILHPSLCALPGFLTQSG